MDVGYDVVRSQIGRAATSCTPYDAEAAAKVGVRTIGVLCSFPEADLRGAGDVAILPQPADVLARWAAFLAAARG